MEGALPDAVHLTLDRDSESRPVLKASWGPGPSYVCHLDLLGFVGVLAETPALIEPALLGDPVLRVSPSSAIRRPVPPMGAQCTACMSRTFNHRCSSSKPDRGNVSTRLTGLAEAAEIEKASCGYSTESATRLRRHQRPRHRSPESSLDSTEGPDGARPTASLRRLQQVTLPSAAQETSDVQPARHHAAAREASFQSCGTVIARDTRLWRRGSQGISVTGGELPYTFASSAEAGRLQGSQQQPVRQ
jgi:hypothetical protein